MKTLDLIGTAIGNTFRSKTRAILTILAIFVGAFTLTLTNGLGTGINRYIADTVSGFGVSDVLTVTKHADASGSGPRAYEPNAVTTGGGPRTQTVAVITTADLDTLAGIDGVDDVEPVRSVSVDYIQYGDGTKYVIGASPLIQGQTVQVSAGAAPDAGSSALQLALPESYVAPLGFASDQDAVGRTVTLAVTDGTGQQQTVEATITGVAEQTFSITGTAGMVPNDALSTALYDTQKVGAPASQLDRYSQAHVWFASDASAEQITALQDRLTAAGFDSTTLQQQLGTFTTVIDGIVLVLNAFAIIALLAASFGIVNTLLMSVQERTREIGLMKAMGMGSGRVFSLFSLEATFIGFLGSAIGAVVAILVGGVISRILANGLLSGLPGLQVIAFDPVSIVVTIVVVMAIAFLAGTLPAARAARQDPVESLRYE
jgi:putative ABC transport system permease protein